MYDIEMSKIHIQNLIEQDDDCQVVEWVHVEQLLDDLKREKAENEVLRDTIDSVIKTANIGLLEGLEASRPKRKLV